MSKRVYFNTPQRLSRATYRQNGLYRLSLRATQHATHAGKHGRYRRTHV